MSFLAPLPFLRRETIRPREDPELLRILLEVLAYENPPGQVVQLTDAAVTASQSIVTHNVDPPTGEDEWLIYGVQLQDTNTVDGGDTIVMQYSDEISGIRYRLGSGTLAIFGSSLFTWPTDFLATTGNPYMGHWPSRPPIVRRKSTTERDKTIRMVYNATGTVGSRNARCFVLYGSRRRLH